MALTTTTQSEISSPRPLDAKVDNEGQQPSVVIRQDPFFITLDASALLAVSVFLVVGMNFMHHLMLEMVIVTIPVLLLVRNDYNNFLNLGPGGTPPTPSGYAKLMWYKMFALRDPFSPPPRKPGMVPAAGILNALPYRPGPRPSVAGLAPQRQLGPPGPRHVSNRLRRSIETLASGNPLKFVTATSNMEKHGFALFSRQPVKENVCGNGEVVHIHNSDRSMHMSLHPDDIKEILRKGWGQRHPMAWSGWVATPIPTTFVMIYAPRDESDLHVVCNIIEAAIWYTTSEKFDIPLVSDL